MSTPRRIQESALATVDEAMRVSEAAPTGVLEAAAGSLFRADGAVKLHVIRPCSGKGRGRHVYEADMLKREAGKFTGWPMYIDHETPEQVRASGGQPPSIFKLGGEILESWWDPNVPAEGRFGQGSVDAWVMPSPWMAQMIEKFPRQVQASVNTFATATKPRRSGNVLEHVVEGFVDHGSVDWVTRAGAGGGIDTSVLESVMESYWADGAMNDEAANWLREHQPAVVEALINPPTNAPTTGEEDTPVEPKELLEAIAKMSDDQRKTVVEAIVASDEAADVIAEAVDDRLKDVLPKALQKAGDAIEESALARVDEALASRQTQDSLLEAAKTRLHGNDKLADAFRDDAWRVIAESKFEPVKANDKGEGGKTAQEVMEAAVDAEVARVTKLQESAGVKPPTRRRTSITGNGGGGGDDEGSVQETEDADDDTGQEARRALQEAGIKYESAYGIPEPKKEGAGE